VDINYSKTLHWCVNAHAHNSWWSLAVMFSKYISFSSWFSFAIFLSNTLSKTFHAVIIVLLCMMRCPIGHLFRYTRWHVYGDMCTKFIVFRNATVSQHKHHITLMKSDQYQCTANIPIKWHSTVSYVITWPQYIWLMRNKLHTGNWEHSITFFNFNLSIWHILLLRAVLDDAVVIRRHL